MNTTPLTFTSPDGSVFTLAQAAWAKQHNRDTVYMSSRPVVGEDWSSYDASCDLAVLGFFAVDLKPHREKRQRQATILRYLEEAYEACGLDRDQVHNRIAAEMESALTNGVWAKSTGCYAAACLRADREVLRNNPAIASSIEELEK